MKRAHYTKDDIVGALRESGIGPEDSVFFTTSLGMLGVPTKEVKTTNDLNELFLSAIKEVLRNGTILVPTYSYTFDLSTATEPSVFDPKITKSEIGSFPNFVLSQDDFIRSRDPFVSVACKGKDCKRLFNGISNSSYGKNSFFSRMVSSNNMKCCSIGLGPNWTPFIHYADWLAKAPHRYDKLFSGYIKEKDSLDYTYWIYNVSFLSSNSNATAHKVGRDAEKAGIWNYANLGRARVYVSNCVDYFNFVMDKLEHDKWSLAKGPQVDVESEEEKRMGSLHENIDASYDISEYKTGEWIGNWLVPERWVCHEAKLIDLKGNILSSTSYLYSLSIEKEVDVEVLKKHVSKKTKNVYKDRDWGFVYDGELSKDTYKVYINSSFGFGTIKILKRNKSIFALLANSLVKINRDI